MSFASAMGGGADPSSPTPYPSAEEVERFHTNSDVNARKESQHHTLGPGEFQASPGSHTHRGGDSLPLLEGLTISGSRNSDAWRISINQILVALGAADNSTP